MEKTYFVEMVRSAVRKKYIFCMSIDSNVFLCSHSQVPVFQLCEGVNIRISLGWDLNEAIYSLPHLQLLLSLLNYIVAVLQGGSLCKMTRQYSNILVE